MVRDWEVLEKLNQIKSFDHYDINNGSQLNTGMVPVEAAGKLVNEWIKTADVPFRVPTYRAIGAIVSV